MVLKGNGKGRWVGMGKLWERRRCLSKNSVGGVKEGRTRKKGGLNSEERIGNSQEKKKTKHCKKNAKKA